MLRCFFFTSHTRSIRCIEVYFPPIDIRTGLLIDIRTGLIIAVRTGQAEPFGSSLFKFSWFIPCHADIINPECADSNADFLIICDKFHVFCRLTQTRRIAEALLRERRIHRRDPAFFFRPEVMKLLKKCCKFLCCLL